MTLTTLTRWSNTLDPPLYLVYRDRQQTPFIVRRIPAGYVIDTFAFSYGTKPWYPTVRQCREHLAAHWPPFIPAISNNGDWNPWNLPTTPTPTNHPATSSTESASPTTTTITSAS